MKVVVYDAVDRLSYLWAIGSVISGADKVIAAKSWLDAYEKLRSLPAIRCLQVWGHGTTATPVIAGKPVSLPALEDACGQISDYIWWRACDVHRGNRGRAFAISVTEVMGCDSVGHCAIISAPNPFSQKAVTAVRPGEDPWWEGQGSSLRGCSTLRMTPPSWAYR